ncbi:MAG: recombinase zinc beta ribbon domain-containing protein [Reyranella sp.]|nr:recombinase zinc beta ribbon domain-containing protein [Reyranella sp.]
MARDDDDFRIRPGKVDDRRIARPRGRRVRAVRARPTSFMGEIHQAFRRAGGTPDRLGAAATKGGGRFNERGRGATAAVTLKNHSPWSRDGSGNRTRARRVAVKARVVKLNPQRGARRGRLFARAKAVDAHLRYLQRDGVTRDGEKGQIYSADRDVADDRAFLDRGREDRHQFRFIVSAEEGVELSDLRETTCDLMKQMEADLGTRLDWIVVDHHNTGHPHTHILLRGVTDDGKMLNIAGDYIAHGVRERASEIVTLELGRRGGRALLAGLLSCGRCGRRLVVSYSGRSPGQPVYRCDRPNLMLGLPRCLTFSGPRVDAAIARELLRAVEPMAIEAAREAERLHVESRDEQQRIVELELQQARYEALLAERRYAACDPDNRLIAAQLEKSWEAALRRVEACEARLQAVRTPDPAAIVPNFAGLAEDLEAAWNAAGVSMRARQRLLRALVTDIIADIDEAAREVVLTVHWRGGQHSQLRVRKLKSGEHGCRTPEDALAVMRSIATRWSDEDIAASLNRMRMPTGQGKTWTAHRVSSLRRVHGIRAYPSAEKTGEWLTMGEAAKLLGVSNHAIRRKGRPCRVDPENQVPMFTDT